MKPNLFRVVDTSSGKVVKDGYMKKSCAKKKRDELNQSHQDDRFKHLKKFRYIVMRSKDHCLGISRIPKNMKDQYSQYKMVNQTKESQKEFDSQSKKRKKKS